MADREALKSRIREAFAGVEYPGDWGLRGSNMGDEPYWVEAEFKGKTDWTKLDAEFLDAAPDGLSSALSFFSEEAFRFYLPAYLIADLDGRLERADPVFQLVHDFTDRRKGRLISARRYGAMTWLDYGRYRCSTFTRAEAAAIVAYLQFKHATAADARDEIPQALKNYWLERAGLSPSS